MRTDPRERAFDHCLQRILAGDSIDEALRLYPQWSEELRPLLEAAAVASRMGKGIKVPRAAQARSRAQFLAAARRYTQPRRSWLGFAPLRIAFVTLFLLVGLLVGSVSTVAVSAQALPGDTLYPIKLLSEQARLLLVKDPVRRLELEYNFDRLRASEVNALIERARSRPVTFAGNLTTMQGEQWEVNGIRVLVAPGTHITGEIQIGTYLGVEGVLQEDGRVLATRIWVREFQIEGLLWAIEGDQWKIGQFVVIVGPNTKIQGQPTLGSQVAVRVAWMADGRLVVTTILEIVPVVTNTATETQTALPTATIKPIPSQTTAAQEQEIEPSRTPRPTEDDGEEDGEDTPEPTKDDDDDDDKEEPTKTPRPSKTPKPTEADDDDDEPTETPKPTETKKPTDDDDDDEETPTPTPTLDSLAIPVWWAGSKAKRSLRRRSSPSVAVAPGGRTRS